MTSRSKKYFRKCLMAKRNSLKITWIVLVPEKRLSKRALKKQKFERKQATKQAGKIYDKIFKDYGKNALAQLMDKFKDRESEDQFNQRIKNI